MGGPQRGYDETAVTAVDPSTGRAQPTIRFGGFVRMAPSVPVISQPLVELYSRVLALGNGAVWVVDKGAGTVVRVDPYR
jgi:hypothetical protein